MMKLQQVKLQHIYREGNQLADLLAEKGRLHEEEGLILVTKLSAVPQPRYSSSLSTERTRRYRF